MSILKKVLLVLVIGIGGFLALFLAFVATRPDNYRVERSQQIDAPAEVVYAQLDNFKSWAAWSPWEKRDPAMKKTFEGPAERRRRRLRLGGQQGGGAGAHDDHREQAAARGSAEAAELTIRLEFIKPFESVATSGFVVKPEGDKASTATWSMEGKNNLMGKAFSVFMNMDKMIGGDFEKGLAGLKTVAEAEARKARRR